jgi:glutathione S-transferase
MSDVTVYGFPVSTYVNVALTGEGQAMLASKPRIATWRPRMEALPSVVEVRSMVMPHIGKPVEHARCWVIDHRPAVRTS